MEIKGKSFGSGMPVLCVSVTERDRGSIVGKIKDLVGGKVQAVEWRADFFEDSGHPGEVVEVLRELQDILSDTIFLFTYRTKAEGGRGDTDPETYLPLLLEAAGTGVPDFIDFETRRTKKSAAFVHKLQEKGCYVLCSFHNFQKTPSVSEMEKILSSQFEKGADCAKIAVMPSSEEDTFCLLQASAAVKKKYPDKPLIAIAMGKKGLASRLVGELSGSALTFVTAGPPSAPGQISLETVARAQEALHECLEESKAGEAGGENRKVYFIGFMGSGKSTVSKQLSKKTGISWIDTDEEIQRQQGKTIADIFEEEGEDAFRQMETECLRGIAEDPQPVIVSCGGGIILKLENIEIMKKSGEVVFLNAKAETIYRHVRHSKNRPLLNGHMNVKYISGMMKNRKPFYDEAKTLDIRTDHKTVGQIVQEIRMRLEI